MSSSSMPGISTNIAISFALTLRSKGGRHPEGRYAPCWNEPTVLDSKSVRRFDLGFDFRMRFLFGAIGGAHVSIVAQKRRDDKSGIRRQRNHVMESHHMRGI